MQKWIGLVVLLILVGCETATESPDEDVTGSLDTISALDGGEQGQDVVDSTDVLVGDGISSDGLGDADIWVEPEPYVFPGESVVCPENTSLEALLPVLNGGKTHPTGRGEQGTAYDPCNRRVILFGGNDYQPEQCADFGPKRFQGDTWIYSVDHENWAQIVTPVAPHPRGRHELVFDLSGKKAYLFGGRFRPEGSQGDYTLFNDLWAFDVATDTWEELSPTGDIPPARTNTGLVYDEGHNRLILFGGSTSTSGLTFLPQNDTYYLDLATLVWVKVETAMTPQARLFHEMVLDRENNRVLLYGGGDENAFFGPFLNDIWAFDLETHVWSQVWLKTFSNFGPDARINPAMVEDRFRGRIILFGGHDDTLIGHRNDVWSFDLESSQWTLLRAGDTGAGTGCGSFCSCPPDFVEVDMASPERRQYQMFEVIDGMDMAVIFGGKGDCGYLDDTWSLSFSKAVWTEIEPAGQGEACKRTGEEGCTDLCY